MEKLSFYNKMMFKVFMTILLVLTFSFITGYFVSIKYTNEIIKKDMIKEFDKGQSIVENFIEIIGQTSQIWARHAVVDNDLKNRIVNKDLKVLDEKMAIEKEAMSADSIILLDKEGTILSEVGSNFKSGNQLLSLQIVQDSFLKKEPITKIIRERETFIIYSSSIIEKDGEIIAIVLVGYYINDIFLSKMKISTDLELAFVGNSAIMSSTKWGTPKEIDILPIEYISYQVLLKNPQMFRTISLKNNSFIVSARKLKLMDSSITGSLLIGYSTKEIDGLKEDIFEKALLLFGTISFVSFLILFFLSKKIIGSINSLKDYTQRISSGDYSKRVSIKTNDELEILSNNFNHMVDAIEAKNKEISEYTTKLELEVEKRSKELLEKEKILYQQSKMASMGEMLENIAHQWRQPLSTISTASTGMEVKKELGVSNDEDEIKTLRVINESAQFLSKTIDDFRNFFRQDKLNEMFNLGDIYKETINILSSKFKKGDIELVETIDDVTVYGLCGETKQVIINLIKNACDVLDQKVQDEKLIFVDIYKLNGFAYICIKDNGGGIKDENVTKVFEPYFTTKHKSQGTGIGLYMCEEMVVKHMHGELLVENVKFEYNNKEYQGATFTAKIPLKREDKVE